MSSSAERLRKKGSPGGDAGRTERLAAQLRENLKRRKARDRALGARREGTPEEERRGDERRSR